MAPSLELVDGARSRGELDRAAELLERIVGDDQRPEAERALAAFLLGRMQLEDLDRPGPARDTFELALKLGLPPVLERSAYAGRALALFADGRKVLARYAAQDFLERYPDASPEHARVRALLAP